MANILLIEPDNILGKTYATALKTAGHNVAHSRHAQDAVRQSDARKPDIIILELQLPGHSGIEFLYEFRSYPEWQNVPIIIHSLVTPEDLRTHLAQFDQLGIEAYLYKPTTNLRRLVRSVGEILQPA